MSVVVGRDTVWVWVFLPQQQLQSLELEDLGCTPGSFKAAGAQMESWQAKELVECGEGTGFSSLPHASPHLAPCLAMLN